MSNDSPVQKVPYPEHPGRCQAVNTKGQCCNLGVLLKDNTHTANCIVHGGNKQRDSVKAESLRNYRLTRFHAELQRHAESPHLKSLRDEIAILRMVLEERLNSCNDATDLILQSGPISELVSKIERVVNTCHKLDSSMGQLLDKQAILNFASVVIGIISKALGDDTEKLNLIADEILATVGRIGNNEDC